eukprot:scaffold53411_cov26-Tisochrysis_lutea.AAC.2
MRLNLRALGINGYDISINGDGSHEPLLMMTTLAERPARKSHQLVEAAQAAGRTETQAFV